MTERTRRPKRGTADMKPFGRVLNKLMVRRDLYEWQDLTMMMEASGYKISGSKLSGYLYGGRHPREPEEFFAAIAEVLDLTDEEKQELTFAYGYPDSYERSRAREATPLTEEEKVNEAHFESRVNERHSQGDEGDEGDERGD